MNGHGIDTCACGAVVAQCRCPGPHTPRVVQGSCAACRKVAAKAERTNHTTGASISAIMPTATFEAEATQEGVDTCLTIWGERAALEALRLELDSAIEMVGGLSWAKTQRAMIESGKVAEIRMHANACVRVQAIAYLEARGLRATRPEYLPECNCTG